MFGVKGSVERRADDVQEGELPSLRGGTTTPGIPCNVCKVNPMSRVRAARHTSAEYDDPSESRMGRVIKCFG